MKGAALKNRQIESTECGLACLAVCAERAGSKIDLSWLRQRFPASLRGTSLEDLSNIAASIGMSARGVKCEPDELRDLQTPTILHWGLDHYVVLLGVGVGSIRLFDPAIGHRKIPMGEVKRRFTGVALEVSATPTIQRHNDRPPLRLWSLLRWTPTIRSSLAQALLLSLLLQVYVIVSPLFMQLAVDEAALKGDDQLLFALAIGFGGLALFNGVAEGLRGVALLRVSSLLSWDMSLRLFHHLIRLPLPWFQRRRLADILTRFQALEPLKNLIANGLVGAVIDGLLSVATATAMVVFAPKLALLAVLGLGLYVLIRLAGIPVSLQLSAEALSATIAEQSKRIETLRAIQTIKGMAGETQREGDWANRMAASIRASQSAGFANLGFSTLQRTLDAVAVVLTVFLGVRQVMGGHMTVGVLYAFLAYRAQFIQRATSLFETFVSWRLLDIYTYRLADVVLTPMEPGVSAPVPGLGGISGDLLLEHASFRYGETEPWVFRDVNLKITQGDFVAIVGPSGAGKSTLLKVLAGLYAPSSGMIFVDGIALPSFGVHSLRELTGSVMQDDDLLPGSISENVSFFAEVLDADWMWECLRFANIADFVRGLPMRAETLVGDMSSNLSGGQKQRLLLARALYKKPQILILDEATSHLDVAAEREIVEALAALNITRIMVSHRPETVRLAERIIALDGSCREFVRKPTAEASPISTPVEAAE